MNQIIRYDYYKNYNFKADKTKYLKNGLCGLINMGNKCYLLSILQCLIYTLKLTDYFISGEYKNDINKKNKNENNILNNYVILLQEIFKENQLIKPLSLVQNINKYISEYNKMNQEDSHECLLKLLDIFHKAISYEITLEFKETNNILMKKYIDTFKNFYQNDYSYIIKLLYGMYLNKIKCINCNFEEIIFEPFNSITLDITIDYSIELKDYLNEYFNDLEINSWKCTTCKKKGCKKKGSIWTLPNYLIITLKKFKNDNKLTKNNVNITFPIEDLDLTKYISKEKNDRNNYIYDLYALNIHKGNLNSGHYISICKHFNEKWYLFDDGNVSQINNINYYTNDVYILFYMRKFIPLTN